MRKNLSSVLLIICVLLGLILSGCEFTTSTATKEAQKVAQQQDQFGKGQPVPAFDWSLERDLVIKLYQLRNQNVVTYSVWRSDYGMIEGDTPSLGYGIPYDVSLTNPLMATDEDQEGYDKTSLTTIEQPEPNGVFASKNTIATWVMSVDEDNPGQLLPIYVETKVTVYPYPVTVDYEKNRVYKAGKPTTTINIDYR